MLKLLGVFSVLTVLVCMIFPSRIIYRLDAERVIRGMLLGFTVGFLCITMPLVIIHYINDSTIVDFNYLVITLTNIIFGLFITMVSIVWE